MKTELHKIDIKNVYSIFARTFRTERKLLSGWQLKFNLGKSKEGKKR